MIKPERDLKEKNMLILKKIKNILAICQSKKYENNLYEIKYPEDIVQYDDIGKGNYLNQYFTSVFTIDTDFEGCATFENGIGSMYFTP